MGSKFFIGFSLLLAAFLFFYFGGWGQFKKIRLTTEKIALAKEILLQGEHVARVLQETQRRIAENQKSIINLENFFLKKGNIEDTTRVIEELTASHGMALLDIKLGQKRERAMSKKSAAVKEGSPAFLAQKGMESQKIFILPVFARLAGGHENFKSFLQRLQKTIPLIEISAVKIVPEKKEGDFFLFDVDFVFYSIE